MQRSMTVTVQDANRELKGAEGAGTNAWIPLPGVASDGQNGPGTTAGGWTSAPASKYWKGRMGWRDRWAWRPYVPRPKLKKLSATELARLQGIATRFAARSPVLSELISKIEVQRGRFYVFDADNYVMGRITPLTGPTFLLEAPWRDGWSKAKSGSWRVVLGALERDERGTFHGLGALATKGKGSVQKKLHALGIPVRVLAEPREWYARHRTPSIIETDKKRHRVLVAFEQFGAFGTFGGTCLYARRDGEWGCYMIRPNASGSIASAETWLAKRGWEGWR